MECACAPLRPGSLPVLLLIRRSSPLPAGSVGGTNMNEHSSRSHAIFTITIECSEKRLDGDQHVRMGKLHLVDLAVSPQRAAASHFFSLQKLTVGQTDHSSSAVAGVPLAGCHSRAHLSSCPVLPGTGSKLRAFII